MRPIDTMKKLDALAIRTAGEKTVELWLGDITAMTGVDGPDAVVVSAFSGDYRPTSSSVIGAFDARGISVEELARCKDVDLLERFGCWLSRDIPSAGTGPKRIICFEPFPRGEPPAVVGDLFRALTPILAVRPDIRSIALPLLSTGDMGYPVGEMMDAILDASVRWMELGLALERLLIVVHSDAKANEAARYFEKRKVLHGSEAPSVRSEPDIDVFVSYAHANAPTMEAFVDAVRAEKADIRLFVDRHELDAGMSWQVEIFRSIDRSRKVAAILSPEYVASKVCEEEFNMAWIRARNSHQDLLFPIYAATTDLPTYMLYKQYVDCRDDDGTKLAEAARRLVAAL